MARGIADGQGVVNWTAPGIAGSQAARILHPIVDHSSAVPRPVRHVARTWTGALSNSLGALALAQVAVTAGALSVSVGSANGAHPSTYQFVSMLLFAVSGLVLTLSAAGDGATRALAVAFLGIGAAFVQAFPPQPVPWLPRSVRWLWVFSLSLPGDLALLVGAWQFIATFPKVESGAAADRLVRRVAPFVTFAAVVMLLANVTRSAMAAAHRPTSVVGWLSRANRDSLYWPVFFGLLVIAIPLAAAKARLACREERGAVRRLLVCLLIGLLPLTVLAATGASSRTAAAFLRQATVAPAATALVFLGLWSLPVTTGLVVLSSRVLPLASIARHAVRYALARSTLTVTMVGPLAAAMGRMIASRDQTIDEFLARGGSTWLLLAGASALLLIVRQRTLEWCDRWFNRHRPESTVVVQALISGARRQTDVFRLGQLLATSLTDYCSPSAVVVLTRLADLDALTPIVGEAASIPLASAVGELLQTSPSALELASGAGEGIADLLPAAERAQFEAFALITPLMARGERLVGAVCLGPLSNGQRYRAEEVATIEAISAAIGESFSSLLEAASDLSDVPAEPAAECERCGVIVDSRAEACRCGGSLIPSLLPKRLGHFTVTRRLGSGGMGVVYEAFDEELNRVVALKTLPEVGHAELRQLKEEARTMAQARHPALATVFGFESSPPVPRIIVEYLAGGTLEHRLKQGPLSEDAVTSVGLSLSDALAYLHDNGILHRDIKPSNVGFTQSGETKLLDFGVATRSDSDSPAAGTLLYVAPEVISGAAMTAASDLWSLAVLLCEAWLGAHPLAALTKEEQLRRLRLGQLWSAVPPDRLAAASSLAGILERALDPDPARRLETAAAFQQELLKARS